MISGCQSATCRWVSESLAPSLNTNLRISYDNGSEWSPVARVNVLDFIFFFKDPATTEISPLPLHDPLPIGCQTNGVGCRPCGPGRGRGCGRGHFQACK